MKFTAPILPLLGLLAGPLAAQTPGLPPASSATATAATHCLLVPLDPVLRAARASRIVEAAVTSSEGLRAANGRLYTRHQLRVFRQLKGPSDSVLTVFTEGGSLGLRREVLTNTLQLVPGEQGIFFLEPAAGPGVAGWQVYGSQQGFIRYNLADLSAAEPFRRYPSPAAAVAAVAATPREVQPNLALAAARFRLSQPPAARPQAAFISGVAPLRLSAGTGAVLTITGTGFGSSRGTGTVEFRNADDGGASFTRINDDDYVSWTDTRVQVRVPALSASGHPAGTGPVRVTPAGAGQLPVLSLQTVLIEFAATNVRDTNTGQRAVPAHRDQNGAGGLTFRFEPGFVANPAAAAAWSRALASWRCRTGINWELGATRTKTGVAADGENSVGFDAADSPLPAGVLGRTTSYYEGCYRPDGTVAFFVQEIDTQYDDAAVWQFGPANPGGTQLDFESVAVHELGHAQQLSHLIMPSAVMHYAIARGQRTRTLALASDVAGGRYVLRTRSFRPDVCGPTAMLPAPLTGQQAAPGTAGVEVQWTTRDECYLSGFVLERAPLDTTAGWQPVAEAAAGAGQYRILDPNPLPGLSYYRLRLRRPDGSLDAARALLVRRDAAAQTGLAVFPNPFDRNGPGLRLQYEAGPAAGMLTLLFYDAVGRYHGGRRLSYAPGLSLLSPALPYLRPGLYLLRWTDSNGPRGTTRLLVR